MKIDENHVGYEIYRQSKEIHEGAAGLKGKKRYFSRSKDRAFAMMNFLNESEKSKDWRVATQVRNRIIFDIDNSDDIENVRKIQNYYSQIFGELEVFKTSGGYHIHSRIYENDWEWHYDCCRVFHPFLDSSEILKYLGKVKDWYNKLIREEFEEKWTKEKYIEEMKIRFPQSGLYCGIGDFDIVFSLMVLLKGYYCVRISKKDDTDEIQKIII